MKTEPEDYFDDLKSFAQKFCKDIGRARLTRPDRKLKLVTAISETVRLQYWRHMEEMLQQLLETPPDKKRDNPSDVLKYYEKVDELRRLLSQQANTVQTTAVNKTRIEAGAPALGRKRGTLKKSVSKPSLTKPKRAIKGSKHGKQGKKS